MISRVVRISFARTASLAVALLAMAVGTAIAQTSTGSIRGYVFGPGNAPMPGAIVSARNTELAIERAANTNDAGFYNLPGLRPGAHELTVRRLGAAPQTRNVRVQIGQTLDQNFTLADTAVTLAVVQVTATPERETKTSEIATNVTQQQIEDLPTSDRNFLNLVTLAPGTNVQNDKIDGTRRTFTAGAQGADQVNVFIDGATYKNDILQGGVAGQDASRGNPFPRNAVQEFRVLTQNYKAEYQKASSAIITATTKSGGPTWTGNVFLTMQSKRWIELDTFQIRDRNTNPTGFRKPDYRKIQGGISGGGPLTEQLRFFGSYETNLQDRTTRVNITPPTGFPALDTINFAARNGLFDSPFRSHLGFGKLTYLHTGNSTFELSFNLRTEEDVRDFGGVRAFETAKQFNNDVYTGLLKHMYAAGSWLNEATLSYQGYTYNPTPKQGGPVNRWYDNQCCNFAEIGADLSVQDFTQKRLSLRNDVTYSGFQWAGGHVIKMGGNFDFLDYDIIKRNSEIPRLVYERFWYGFAFPQRVEYQTGDPNFGATNKQVGLYAQDDWSPTPRLTLNLGLRWDYESDMVNYDFVTPRAVVDSLRKYRDSLYIPLNESRYFTDGSQRDRFYGAFQPRIGLSYALTEDSRTVVFGGWGIFYDRTLFDHAIEERFALQHPSYRIEFTHPDSATQPGKIRWEQRFLTEGKPAIDAAAVAARANNPEVKLLPNDIRPPKSNQFTAGIRQLFGNVAVEAAYTGVRSSNTLTFYFANFNFVCPDRNFGTPNCFRIRNVPGFSTILFADNAGKTWYDALQLKVDRAYRRSSEDFGWGAGLAYTFAYRETEGFNDLFSFPNPVDYPRQPRNDERHRVVSNWIVDLPYLWGIQFSGLITLGSGALFDVGDRFGCYDLDGNPATPCTRYFDPGGGKPERHSFIIPNFWAYRTVDVRLRKDFLAVGGNRAGVTIDVFNLFNYTNLGDYENVPIPTDPNFGRARQTLSDPRRLQLGVEYDF
jgi:hypothetical protein